MNKKKICLLSFLLLTLLFGQVLASIDSSKSTYLDMLGKIAGDFDAEQKKALSQYSKNLNLLKGVMQNKGDLDSFLSVQAEMKRLNLMKTVPAMEESEAAPVVLTAQALFWRVVGQAEENKKQKHISLAEKFKGHLESLKKQLTKSGKIDEAIKARDALSEIDKELKTLTSRFGEGVEVKIEKCSSCNGSGKVTSVCPRCKGGKKCLGCAGVGKKKRLGRLMMCVQCKSSGNCRDCNGSGSVAATDCVSCAGKGEIEVAVKTVPVNVASVETVSPKVSTVSEVVKIPPQIIKKDISSGSLDKWFSSYVNTMGELYASFKKDEAEKIDFEKFVLDPDAYQGKLLESTVYVFSAFPRSVVVSSATKGKKKAELMPYSLSVGKTATAAFQSAGTAKKVKIVFGVVSKDNVTLFSTSTL